ncbi:MAG: rhodanese-like domain-containing protein [Anaerolineae bacterium]|nr:rhodanese-like domain-containing protein [Anaerolineae bacterium]
MIIGSMTPQQLKQYLDAGDPVVVIDVRNPWELEISQMAFARLIVLDELPERMDEIPKDQMVVLVCRSGGRSQMAGDFLATQGWDPQRLFNLEGGILGWARDVDPSLPAFY